MTLLRPRGAKWPYVAVTGMVLIAGGVLLLGDKSAPHSVATLPAPPVATSPLASTAVAPEIKKMEPLPIPVTPERAAISRMSVLQAASPVVRATVVKEKGMPQHELARLLIALEQEKTEAEKRFAEEEARFTKEQVDLESKLRQQQALLDKEKQESDARLKQEHEELDAEKKMLKSIQSWPFHPENEKELAEAKVKGLQAKYDKRRSDAKAKHDQDQAKIDKERNDSRGKYINAMNVLTHSKSEFDTAYQTRRQALEKQRPHKL